MRLEVWFLTQKKIVWSSWWVPREKMCEVSHSICGWSTNSLSWSKWPRLRAKGGWAVRPVGAGCLPWQFSGWLTPRQSVSYFIWDLHPSITSIKGLIFSQALSHLLDTKKLLSFPAKDIPTCIFIDINHLQNHSFLQLSLFYLLTPFLL